MIRLRVDDETAIPLSVDSSSAVSMTVSEAFIDRGGSAIQNNKNATPSTSQVVVTPDAGYDGMAKVTVAAMPQGEVDPASLSYDEYLLRGRITAEANVTQAGYVPLGGNMARAYCDELLPSENPKTVTPTTSEQVAVAANKWTKGQIKVGPIPSEYIIPTGTKSISANGTGIDVKAYEKVDVAVPGITPSGTLAIATNGSHDVTNYATASVAVPASAVDSGTKSITANGTHNVVGYASANVNVPNTYSQSDEGKVVQSGALVSQSSQTVTENGTYDTTTKNEVVVDVSGGDTPWTWKEDGKTHVWLDIQHQENLTQYVGLKVNKTNNNIIVDWGDNSTIETVNTTSVTNLTHTYAQLGKYEIVMQFNLGSGQTTGTATLSELTNPLCAENVYAIEFSSLGYWASNAFSYMPNLVRVNQGACVLSSNGQYGSCARLEEITGTKNGTTTMPSGWTQDAHALKRIGVFWTNVCSNGMKNCFSVSAITFPSTFTAIGQSAFQNCISLKEIHFENTTPPTMANVNAFSGTRSDMKIYVPYSADHSVLAEYKGASNWSTYADQIFEEPAP